VVVPALLSPLSPEALDTPPATEVEDKVEEEVVVEEVSPLGLAELLEPVASVDEVVEEADDEVEVVDEGSTESVVVMDMSPKSIMLSIVLSTETASLVTVVNISEGVTEFVVVESDEAVVVVVVSLVTGLTGPVNCRRLVCEMVTVQL